MAENFLPLVRDINYSQGPANETKGRACVSCCTTPRLPFPGRGSPWRPHYLSRLALITATSGAVSSHFTDGGARRTQVTPTAWHHVSGAREQDGTSCGFRVLAIGQADGLRWQEFTVGSALCAAGVQNSLIPVLLPSFRFLWPLW